MAPRTLRVTRADTLKAGDAVVVLFQGSHALATVIEPGDGALLVAEKENAAALRVDPRLTVVLKVPAECKNSIGTALECGRLDEALRRAGNGR
jgi:SOS-response transcriptional repressor LexA